MEPVRQRARALLRRTEGLTPSDAIILAKEQLRAEQEEQRQAVMEEYPDEEEEEEPETPPKRRFSFPSWIGKRQNSS